MKITALGLDFRTAAVELREQVAMSPGQSLRLLEIVAAEKMFSEAMVLSTCNRTEFYLRSNDDAALSLPHLLGHVAQIKGIAPLSPMPEFYRYDDLSAVEHLFRVASGLESQALGEHEIAAQVKEAYRLSCEASTAGFIFHKMLHRAFRTSKRVVTETALGQGTASISQAAVDLASQVFSHLADRTVLLIGAGQAAEAAAQALLREGVHRLIVANRTLYKAQQLAGDLVAYAESRGNERPRGDDCPAMRQLLAECKLPHVEPQQEVSARGIGLEEVAGVLAQADVIISSTGSQDPVLTTDVVQPALAARKRPLLMIDIAVPRDIDASLAELPNVLLYNIDALQGLIDRNLRRRQGEVPKAQAIVADELKQFEAWLGSLEVVPTIQLLEQRIRSLGQAELARRGRKLSPEARREAEEVVRTLCGKILHDPIMFLKRLDDANGKGDRSGIHTLREIFGLDDGEPSP